MFIMIDGIDGSGKSTIIDAWKKNLEISGKKIFDLKKYWITNNRYPTIEEIEPYDIIFSCEMTHVGIGKVIRNELISNQNNYSPLAIAEAYSLDRLVLYTKIIIPALKSKKVIIQDRGISSSLAYQTIMDDLNFSIVSNLPGNVMALNYSPDYLVLVKTSPKVALARIMGRYDKQDNSIFEKADLLEKISANFESDEYKKVFNSTGTKIINLNGNEKIDIMQTEAVNWLKTIL